MTEEIITLSRREFDRLSIIQSTVARQINQAEAARQLGISIRQVKRLVRSAEKQRRGQVLKQRRGQVLH